MEKNIVRGTGVVAGYAYAPAAWTRPAPVPPTHSAPVAEDAREAEVARFKAAVETVATRFADRASDATGVAAEVLGATAALARDLRVLAETYEIADIAGFDLFPSTHHVELVATLRRR